MAVLLVMEGIVVFKPKWVEWIDMRLYLLFLLILILISSGAYHG